VRIIGGNLRGKKITAPESLPVRPTTDFAKTGLFNILLNKFDLSEIAALDLYAGTGSITYELYSRGCMNIDAADRNRDCASFMQKTLEQLRAPHSVKAFQADAVAFLQKNAKAYDLIFADPPFEEEVASILLNTIREYHKLKPDGLFILEHVTGRKYNELPGFEESRKYGNVSFSFFT
jgi:16S rRNA (guanine966-N2)-methyltransferase